MIELEELLVKVREEVNKILENNILGLFVYGSAAVNDYLAATSDINLLLVLKTVDLATLDKVRQFTKKMSKYRITTPLLMTEKHIKTSADVFPVEFLEIKEKHRLLAGKEYFTNLKISTRNLRHECEHELKGRLIRIRQSFLETDNNAQALKELLLSAHNANFPAFRTALRLKRKKPPFKKEEVTAALVKNFGLDEEMFLTIKRLRLKEIKLDLNGLRELIIKYLIEVEKLAAVVDVL